MSILVTGGAGYIGSHTVIELLNAGYEVVVLDNLVNSSKESLKRVEEITGKKVTFYEGDIADRELLKKMFEAENIDSCIHFAGLKAVGESVSKPLEYYSNNISGSLVLFDESFRDAISSSAMTMPSRTTRTLLSRVILPLVTRQPATVPTLEILYT